jgi:glycosyltransferase involved in cell wall biosynthesis
MPAVKKQTPAPPPAVSVIVPAFNEIECIPFLISELVPALEGLDAEIVLVDDGSTDGTAQETKKHPAVRYIGIPHSGKTAALRTGIDEARSDTIVTIDADLQEDPRQIREFLQIVGNGADLVAGYRRHRADSLWTKKIPSFVYSLLIALLFQRDIKDVNCGFRAARRETLQAIPWFDGSHRLIPLLVLRGGGTVRQVEVHHRPRRCGEPKFQSPRRFFEGLRDLARVRLGLS